MADLGTVGYEVLGNDYEDYLGPVNVINWPTYGPIMMFSFEGSGDGGTTTTGYPTG